MARRIILPVSLSLLSGILLFIAGFPGIDIGIPFVVLLLVFFAPVPLLYILLKEKPVHVFFLSFITWCIGYFPVFIMYYKQTGFAVSFLLVITFAMIFSLFSLIYTCVNKVLHPVFGILFFASGFVFIEWIFVFTGMGLHAITASASVSGVPWLLACSSIGGSYFITFFLRLVPAAIMTAFVEKKTITRFIALAIPVILFFLLFIFGIYRVSLPETYNKQRSLPDNVSSLVERNIRVAAIVYELPEWVLTFYKKNKEVNSRNQHQFKENMYFVLNEYDKLMRKSAASKAEVISGPECSLFVPGFLLEDFTQWLQKRVVDYFTTIVIGFRENVTPANSALVALPDGCLFKIDKHYLVPFYESNYYVPGPEEPVVIDTGTIKLGVKICFELHFPGTFRKMAKKGVDLLVAPFLDWREIAVLHAYETHYRGVENGMALLRPCRQGLTTIVDPYGNVIAKAFPDSEILTCIVADVPIKERSGTFYTYTGDWIVYTSILIILICVFRFIIKYIRKNRIRPGKEN